MAVSIPPLGLYKYTVTGGTVTSPRSRLRSPGQISGLDASGGARGAGGALFLEPGARQLEQVGKLGMAEA